MCMSASAAWYVCGAFQGWDAGTAVEMKAMGEGKYELTLDKMKAGFKIIDAQAWGGVELGAPEGTKVDVNNPDGFQLTNENGKDITFSAGDVIKDVTLGLDESTMKLYVYGEYVYEIPTLYLCGNWMGNDTWAQNDLTLMNQNGSIFTKNYTLEVATYESKVSAEGWAPQWGWYEAPEANLSLENPVVGVDKKGDSDPGNIKIDVLEAGEYTFTFDYDANTLAMSKASGIESIDVDNNVAPVYYNLQGVRVNNPENGLFIKVCGKEVTKVIR